MFNGKRLLLIGLLGLVIPGLTSCIFVGYKPPAGTNLIARDLRVVSGETRHLYITVSEMPGEGIAAIQAAEGGFSYDPRVIQVTGIGGRSGFEVLAHEFDNTNGKGRFAAVYPTDAVTDGDILVLTVTAAGNPGDTCTVKFIKDKLTLGDANNNEITEAMYKVVDGTVSVK